jgi:hypothetical protein
MEFILLIVAWIVLSHVVAAIIPLLLELLPELIFFICACLWEVVRLLFRAAFWLLAWTIRFAMMAARGLWLGLVMLFFVADDWRRGPRVGEEARSDEFPDGESEKERQQAAYEQALALLGLTPGFTHQALKRAYHAAIRIAHPDAGGSVEAAQAVNSAYRLIRQIHGWG